MMFKKDLSLNYSLGELKTEERFL